MAGRAQSYAHRGVTGRPALVNGSPGWVSHLDGEVLAIGAVTIRDGRITRMDILRDPRRIADLGVKSLDS